jgi:hypothetical protein
MEQTSGQKGRESELNVASVLEELKTQGLIKGYRRTKHCSADDMRGIDYWIFFEEAPRMPLQVKSSRMGLKFHYESSNVPCVIGRGRGLKVAVIRLIGEFLSANPA